MGAVKQESQHQLKLYIQCILLPVITYKLSFLCSTCRLWGTHSDLYLINENLLQIYMKIMKMKLKQHCFFLSKLSRNKLWITFWAIVALWELKKVNNYALWWLYLFLIGWNNGRKSESAMQFDPVLCMNDLYMIIKK